MLAGVSKQVPEISGKKDIQNPSSEDNENEDLLRPWHLDAPNEIYWK